MTEAAEQIGLKCPLNTLFERFFLIEGKAIDRIPSYSPLFKACYQAATDKLEFLQESHMGGDNMQMISIHKVEQRQERMNNLKAFVQHIERFEDKVLENPILADCLQHPQSGDLGHVHLKELYQSLQGLKRNACEHQARLQPPKGRQANQTLYKAVAVCADFYHQQTGDLFKVWRDKTEDGSGFPSTPSFVFIDNLFQFMLYFPDAKVLSSETSKFSRTALLNACEKYTKNQAKSHPKK